MLDGKQGLNNVNSWRGTDGVCHSVLPNSAVVESSAKGKDVWSYKPLCCEQGQL